MAEMIRTVKPSGGDYTTLRAWEAGRQGNLPSDGNIEIADCYSLEDVLTVYIVGWTTDADNYPVIRGAGSDKTSSNTGKWSTERYRMVLPSADSAKLEIEEAYVRIDGIQMEVTFDSITTAYVTRLWGEADYVLISNSIFKVILSGTNSDLWGIYAGADDVKIWNCVFYDFINSTDSVAGINIKTAIGYVYNCTFHNCFEGIKSDVNKCIAVNNLFVGCTSPCGGDTFLAGTDYNATDGATIDYTVTGSGNTHDQVDQEVTFVNEGGDDFHLASNDVGAMDLGKSDPGSGLFSDDIDGVVRTGAWDIGADEYVAVADSWIPRVIFI